MRLKFPKMGDIAERRSMDRLGARGTPASGALDGAKSDGILDRGDEYSVRVEHKATEAKSMRIELEWLLKIMGEAMDHGQVPALAISFVSGDGRPRKDGAWVAIPEYVFLEIFGDSKRD
jgi:hypothetical protein